MCDTVRVCQNIENRAHLPNQKFTDSGIDRLRFRIALFD